jgi:hypothetical protein
LQELEERVSIRTVDLYLLEAGELGTEVQLAELMDRVIGARSLLSELIAREVEDDKMLRTILLIELFEFIILRCKAALGGSVHDKHNLIGILTE